MKTSELKYSQYLITIKCLSINCRINRDFNYYYLNFVNIYINIFMNLYFNSVLMHIIYLMTSAAYIELLMSMGQLHRLIIRVPVVCF